MKTSTTHPAVKAGTVTVARGVVLSIAAFAGGAQAQTSVLLEIDVTSPSSATITATGAPSLVNDFTSDALSGVTVVNLFTADATAPAPGVLGGGLTPLGVAGGYNRLGNGFAGIGPRDLNLYNGTLMSPQFFTTVGPAFSGAATIDLGFASHGLPGVGAVGDVIAGDTLVGSGAVIGQWRVVPAPASGAMLALLAPIAARRRRG